MSKDPTKPFRDAQTDRAAAQDAPDTRQTRAPAYKLAFADDEFYAVTNCAPCGYNLNCSSRN